MNIDPRGIPIREWCDSMVQELDGYGQVPELGEDESQWQVWAQNLMLLEKIAGNCPPNPMDYTDFYEWAQLFNMTVLL